MRLIIGRVRLTPWTMWVEWRCASNDYGSAIMCMCVVPDAKLFLIAHPHNINRSDIWELKNLGVTLLRLCLNKMISSLHLYFVTMLFL
ncbi:hypothetical protein ABID39_000233 [Bartonella japonica]|uniref:Uncharacterized protein n=1 Tax=Bartonella japonica TaxID=357761 RepID=A0ABV2FM43_9HYPH